MQKLVLNIQDYYKLAAEGHYIDIVLPNLTQQDLHTTASWKILEIP